MPTDAYHNFAELAAREPNASYRIDAWAIRNVILPS